MGGNVQPPITLDRLCNVFDAKDHDVSLSLCRKKSKKIPHLVGVCDVVNVQAIDVVLAFYRRNTTK